MPWSSSRVNSPIPVSGRLYEAIDSGCIVQCHFLLAQATDIVRMSAPSMTITTNFFSFGRRNEDLKSLYKKNLTF